jgi:predicted esterase
MHLIMQEIYSFDLSKTIAIGFSNGANIATSILLLEL